MLLGFSIIGINYRGYFLTKEGLINGILGY